VNGPYGDERRSHSFIGTGMLADFPFPIRSNFLERRIAGVTGPVFPKSRSLDFPTLTRIALIRSKNHQWGISQQSGKRRLSIIFGVPQSPVPMNSWAGCQSLKRLSTIYATCVRTLGPGRGPSFSWRHIGRVKGRRETRPQGCAGSVLCSSSRSAQRQCP
jgi:hypothetical protein